MITAAPSTVVLMTDSGASPAIPATEDTPTQWVTHQATTNTNYSASLTKNRTEWLLVNATSDVAGDNDYGAPMPRHQGMSNVLWCDGHVKALPVEKFFVLYGSSVSPLPTGKSGAWSPCLDVAYGCSYMTNVQ